MKADQVFETDVVALLPPSSNITLHGLALFGLRGGPRKVEVRLVVLLLLVSFCILCLADRCTHQLEIEFEHVGVASCVLFCTWMT